MDRLGSDIRGTKYFPYGVEATATASDRDKFATYYRDSTPGLDYADQRFYSSAIGRFMTLDAGKPDQTKSQSWNRYSYSGSDPANSIDPTGQDFCSAEFQACQYLGGIAVDVSGAQCIQMGMSFGIDNLGYFQVMRACQFMPDWFLAAAAPPPPTQEPSCSLELEYRQAALTGGSHASLVVSDQYGYTFTIQGQPQNYPFPSGVPPTWGNLVVGNIQGNIRDQQWGLILTSSTDSNLCAQIIQIESAENYYSNHQVTYYPWGPNSNTLIHWLLDSGYVDKYFTAPPKTTGCDTPLYGTILGIH